LRSSSKFIGENFIYYRRLEGAFFPKSVGSAVFPRSETRRELLCRRLLVVLPSFFLITNFGHRDPYIPPCERYWLKFQRCSCTLWLGFHGKCWSIGKPSSSIGTGKPTEDFVVGLLSSTVPQVLRSHLAGVLPSPTAYAIWHTSKD
jgi:hypothetical protein